MARFPTQPHPSLEAIPPSSEIRQLYPRDTFPNPRDVRLPLGKTAYWIFGPEDGPKVVLIHGISSPSIMWKSFAPFLAENGFRVLVYDLFGRGYSEAPKTTYDADLYITQLALLLQHVGFASAHVVGLSMGGGVAAAFAATFPNLVTRKIVFLASAGLMELPAQVTLPKDVAAVLAGPTVSQTGSLTHQFRRLQTECLPGYEHAVTSSLKHGPITEMDNAFKAIASIPRLKCLIVHGTHDGTVNFKFGVKIKALLPQAEFVPIEGADHDFVINDKYLGQVRSATLKFLQS